MHIPKATSGLSPIVPSDPGDALERMLDLSEELIREVGAAFKNWVRLHPLRKLVREWNTDWERYQAELSRHHILSDPFALDTEARRSQLREMFREAGTKKPERPVWNPTVVQKWRPGQTAALAKVEQLRKSELVALPIIGSFPTRNDQEIQHQVELLVSDCQTLAWFCPLGISQIKRVTPKELEAESNNRRKQFDMLVYEVRSSASPLRKLLALYRGKQRVMQQVTALGDYRNPEKSRTVNTKAAKSKPGNPRKQWDRKQKNEAKRYLRLWNEAKAKGRDMAVFLQDYPEHQREGIQTKIRTAQKWQSEDKRKNTSSL
jgi:hypothetical protein